MKARFLARLFPWTLLILAILALGSACAPTARAPAEEVTEARMPAIEAEKAAPLPTMAPMAPESKTSLPGSDSTARYASVERMIIKNAEMELLVENTDVAIDRITGLVIEYDGYVISSRSWYSGLYKEATVTIGVPVYEFENMLRRLRGLAVRVEQESSSGEDVTDQYVDLDSRIKNLEATADRIRSFLDSAQTVEEALMVNDQLSQVEGEIETLKGKLNYLADRSAFSTITVQLKEPRPTPTPSPTATPTTWDPGHTFKSAGDVLTNILRFLGDTAIWAGVVCMPIAIPAALIAWFVIRQYRKRRRGRQVTQAGEDSQESP